MASSSSARKKSIISSQTLHIDTPVNTLLNKAASQSTSLYQQCSSLRARLLRIRGFQTYFDRAHPTEQSTTDPVTQLWDLFTLGISLCYIFDQLPEPFPKIKNNDFKQDKYEASPDREKKHAIALFAMQVRNKDVMSKIPGLEPFAITDLWDRKSTDGLVKVINSVTAIVEYLPEDVFERPPPSTPPTQSAHGSSDSILNDSTLPGQPAPPLDARQSHRNNVTREILETERKFVEQLEAMQKYATQLAQQNVIDQDTIHLLFPNLNNLLNFQRKFLIRLETTLEQPWPAQRWGQHFLECEEEFAVYEPYCSNFTQALELLLSLEPTLAGFTGFISLGEVKAFHITPIQRICKYPLLLNDLIKVATGDDTYPHLDNLKQGADAAQRITTKINEAHRRADNEQIVKALAKRITDWKGHHLENFGELLLEDKFSVTKSDIDREYHVFLFEKIILCCKEAPPGTPNGATVAGRGGKAGKNGSILKKQPAPLALATGGQSIAQRDGPLLLKGRIFISNVTQAVPVPQKAVPTGATGIPASFPLQVWWKGDDDLEYFTLRCTREDQMRKWEATINRVVKEAAQRRASDFPHNAIARVAAHSNHVRVTPGEPSHHHHHNASQSFFSQAGSTVGSSVHSQASSTVSARTSRSNRGYPSYDPQPGSYGNGSVSAGPNGYPPHDGFDRDEDDDEEDYPPSSSLSTSHSMSNMSGAYSGRGTPMGRRPNALSMPAEQRERQRTDSGGYERDRPRAQTESNDGPTIAQWRNNLPAPPVSAQHPPSHSRPHTPRLTPSGPSWSEGPNGAAPKSSSRPGLRSQFSSTRLRSTYETDRERGGSPSLPAQEYRGNAMRSTTPTAAAGLAAPPPMSRSRSASQPTAYIPPGAPLPAPPLPHSQSHWGGAPGPRTGIPVVNGVNGITNGAPNGERKRGSGSSQSTGDSSDYSPNSSSPVTPFGSSESSLLTGVIGRVPSGYEKYPPPSNGVGIPHHPGQYVNGNGYGGLPSAPNSNLSNHNSNAPVMKVKVHFYEDIFMIQVPKTTEFEDLVEKVGKKIRLCGPRRDDGPLRVKYRDEDGDMVSLGSTEDVQMAFEQNGQVTLFVT